MAFAQQDLEELDPTVLDRLPPDVREKIEQGLIDKLPEDVVDALPASMQDRVPPGLIEAASGNPTLTAVLIIAGIVGVIGFFYGVAKSAFKAAAFFAVVAVVAWVWLANK